MASETRVYRKAFLYGDYEKRLFAAATPQACIVDVSGLKVGVLICYDVEFPENVRRLAQAGADLVAVPTALPASDHEAFISGSIIPVRAFENQVHVAYANHCGADDNFAYAGLSRVAAPDGGDARRGERRPAQLLIADIEPAAYPMARDGQSLPRRPAAVGAHARPAPAKYAAGTARLIRKPPLRRRSWTSRR